MRVVIDAVARMLALYEDQEDVRIEHQRMYEFAEPVAINGFEGEGMIEAIKSWHEAARPEPTQENLRVQIGCHIEEFAEMLEALRGEDKPASLMIEDIVEYLHDLADMLKSGKLGIEISDRVALLDSLADQIVTAVGVGHCARMRICEAVAEVNRSNWSKFVDGKPIFDSNGKIAKGPNYTKPDIKEFASC